MGPSLLVALTGFPGSEAMGELRVESKCRSGMQFRARFKAGGLKYASLMPEERAQHPVGAISVSSLQLRAHRVPSTGLGPGDGSMNNTRLSKFFCGRKLV